MKARRASDCGILAGSASPARRQAAQFMPAPRFEWLGRRPYRPVWEQLRARAVAVADGVHREMIWSCEHEPVYTTGRRGIDNRLKKALPADFVVTDRGGETTFHGPGQLMLYPVLNLKARGLGARDYVALLEQSCIALLRSRGVEARRRCGYPGVWTDAGKIAALGVRIRRGVAYHGMALNVNVQTCFFEAIRPCGLDSGVVSMADFGAAEALPGLAEDWYDCLASLLAGDG